MLKKEKLSEKTEAKWKKMVKSLALCKKEWFPCILGQGVKLTLGGHFARIILECYNTERRWTGMIQIAICDSDRQSRQQLQGYCQRIEAELHLPINCKVYETGEELLNHMAPDVDMVFMDAKLSDGDGIQVARQIRVNNASVLLIFVTDHLAAAVDSYRVQAADFIPKPASYEAILHSFSALVHRLEHNREEHVVFRTTTQWVRIPINSILYIESARNKAVIHTVISTYEMYITMKEVETQLNSSQFFRCHSGFIVNLNNVVSVNGLNAVMIDGAVISISKYRKKEFMEKLVPVTEETLMKI